MDYGNAMDLNKETKKLKSRDFKLEKKGYKSWCYERLEISEKLKKLNSK